MKCPRDGTTLSRVDVANIELDKCHKCDGIWFDRGEMEKLRDANLSEVEEALERRYGDPSYEEGTTEGYMRCPRCVDGRLQGCTYTFMHPVRIDRCEKCFGVWLDKGELDRIVGEKRQLDEAAEPNRLRAFMRSVMKTFGS